ncbi:MAG: carboxypeptidase M32 [Gemmatimonadetes bacterium]|nr:carboxypeptidase M32 [Gemmatimonadota bacterium]MBT5327707.1 carboxypeptidase M32 [Gemmatimonadota bacterium]MBT5453135.1 carboxypeptidase M32 [Gemmatimonadota bacterium]MBT6622525.1 carboxypeptidase M32 [Gemmatimonadota bacterium]MBT7421198.1 carboxypeptidase M32 [Gemmatimonadota bacterium]
MAKVAELADIGHAEGMLSWDQETYMPPKGAAMRARAQGTLAGLHHERLTAPELVGLVKDLKGQDLTGDAAVNVREVGRSQDRALKIPKELVVELSQTESLSHEAWIAAREKADFAHFQPWLEKILKLKKEVAERVGYEGTIYNALLDEYEPYTRAEDIEPVFAALKDKLVPLVEKIAATGKFPARGVLDQDFPVAEQEELGRQVLEDLGFDLEAGRLDVAVHPFCSGTSRDDVRLTTRYSADWLPGSLFGTIHEAGHGLYEQGLPEDAVATPAGGSVSLGIHESQSRLWENMVGRSRAFSTHYLPRLKALFPTQLQNVNLDEFYAAVNQVEPSLIRVEADEVTYNLHILLRFELERDLFEGRVEVKDLPSVWNERMQQYLGVCPPDDAQGVLQDVHWSFGLMGYFPTYTLGNLYGAQFFHQAQQELPDLEGQIGRGEFGGLKTWLNDKVHNRGSRLRASELVEEVTGEKLSADYFTNYLEAKFGALYNL